ncbi:MAG: arginine--tRNA ligase [Mycoplasmoidaceae bacterium]
MNLKNESVVTFIKEEILAAIRKFEAKYHATQPIVDFANINVDKTRNSKYGDFTTNVVLSLQLGNVNKIEAAKEIAELINPNSFAKIEVAGPGFINFYLNDLTKQLLLEAIDSEGDSYGQLKKKKLWYNIEFVSANPTGLLHIGHARNGAYGDSLARIFEANGIKVDREYYINDGGNQINKLALSVLIRYLQDFGKPVELPEDSYHAQEIIETARLLKYQYNDKFVNTKFDENKILDEEANKIIGTLSKNYLLGIIKDHLAKLDVKMDLWSPESYIYENDLINKAFAKLSKFLYDADGAKWLKTTEYGDDKDRVLVKSDGNYTYFTPDIAYHNLKLSRGYDKIFNIWGADHKSYVDRMSTAIQMLGFKKEQMHVCIMQMVQLTKNGQEFKMSKRTGNSFTTIDLINLIGKDAARWYLVNQSLDSHITIDIEKAGKKNNENGLFYVQYAYVRIKQILAKVQVKKFKAMNLLTHNIEKELINQMFFFMPTIENIGKTYEVHKMCLYLTNLAKLFHTYYEQVRIGDGQDKDLIGQRLYLIDCVATVIKNGLKLIGVNVVDKM